MLLSWNSPGLSRLPPGLSWVSLEPLLASLGQLLGASWALSDPLFEFYFCLQKISYISTEITAKTLALIQFPLKKDKNRKVPVVGL